MLRIRCLLGTSDTLTSSQKGEAPLHIACRRGHLQVASSLSSADVNLQCKVALLKSVPIFFHELTAGGKYSVDVGDQFRQSHTRDVVAAVGS